jgi:hypothetical protein
VEGKEAMKIEDRYSSAIRSSNLRSNPETNQSDADVIGAAGLASKQSPLAISLLRLFVGGDSNGAQVVEQLAAMAVGKAYRMGAEIGKPDALTLAWQVLAYHRNSICKSCSGHGLQVIPNVPVLSAQRCPACKGSGTRSFNNLFSIERLELARWLLVEMERETAIAGPLAMARLAPRLDL